MTPSASTWEETGLEVTDLPRDAPFGAREVAGRDAVVQMEAMRRIAHALVENPENLLQELVKAAVEVCGADSAGISIEKENGTEAAFYHWVATAGEYSAFMDAVLPRYPSACGICLERGQAQRFRVGQRFFEIMGIEAPLVTDGILLPWKVEEMRGTIFIMAHHRSDAFDQNDYRMMEILADFAAAGVRQQRQQALLVKQASASAAAAMANELAHRINNPLQSLTNLLYLAALGHNGEEAIAVGKQAFDDLQRLSLLVNRLLALPYREIHPTG
jgi:hypothetical protein